MLRNDLVYKDLSYKIVGVLLEVYINLGSGHRELYYQRAVSNELRRQNISFKEQVQVDLIYKNDSLGKYILDFLIDEKIVLEIKKDDYFSHQHIKQTLGYLKALNLKLGILANFTKTGMKF